MIKIISVKIFSFVRRVTALLEAKSISYVIEFIILSDNPQWFLDLSPTGQVPILSTTLGVTLFEFETTAEYIDEIYSAT
jgi:glutathione S-transferase